MANTKAKWFTYKPRPAGAKPVYEPQRPPRPRPPTVPDTRRDYPLPGSYPGDRRRPISEPLPRRPGEPMGPGFDPRFQPVPESAPRPVSPRPEPVKRIPNLARRRIRIPGGVVGFIPDAANWADGFFFPNPDANVPPRLPANYVWCNGPTGFPPIVPRPFPYGYWLGPPFFNDSGSCAIGLPLSGQSAAAFVTWKQAFASSPATRYYRRLYKHSGAFNRDYIAGTVQRVGPAINPQPAPHRAWNGFPATNPNQDRWLPTFPDPFADPKAKPELQVGYAEPLVGPEGFANPDLPYQPDYQWSWQIGVGLDAPLSPSVDNPVDHPEPPLPPVKREPPRRGEKQRKVMTKTKAIGIALYKALDAVSESAEVVDAVYDALPADVRKRWEKERFPDARWVRDKNTGKWERVGVERPGDNFGQYGIDGADWKLQALYYNWHKVDVEKAIKNIIKNELSDRVIGGIQAGLPKNSGAAHSQGEMELGQSLDDWFSSELGL